MPGEIAPAELRARLGESNPPLVLDVREPAELPLARFAGALEIPMNDLPGRIAELPRDTEIVVLCHHGVRSAQVAGFLAAQGFERVANLAGGIDAWSILIDPAIPRY